MVINRRQFLAQAARSSAAVAVPMLVSGRAFGANDEIRLAVIGCGVRGGTHVPEFGKLPGVRIAAVCDPDHQRLSAAVKSVATRFGGNPQPFVDVRKLMDEKNLDAVSVATMQYWHSLPTIWACQSGKHVYVEKPLAHFIWEGRQMVRAARRFDRLVQIGTQSRSVRGYAAMSAWLKAGHLGKIQYVTCFANKPRRRSAGAPSRCRFPSRSITNYGAVPRTKEPIYRDQIQYDCSFIWNMGDGESCNQGVHEVDVALDPGLHRAAAADDEHRRPFPLQRCRRSAQHADHLLRLSRGSDPLRGPQPAQETRTA